MGYVSFITRSQGQILEEKPEGKFSVRLSRNFVRMFVLMISKTILKMGHVRSKTKSLGVILEKPCVRTIGHTLSPIIMKLGQKVCLDEIWDEFENRSCPSKNEVTRSNLRKTLCMLWRPDFQSRIFVLMKSHMRLKISHVR